MRPLSQRGFTLIELLISALLGVLLLGALISLFLQSRQSFRQNDQIIGMQDQARFALQTLSRDLTAAGFWGGLASSSDITLAASVDELTPANDCGPNTSTPWARNVASRVEFLNNVAAADVAAAHHCIDSSRVVEGSDLLATRRVATVPTAEMDATDTDVTLRKNHFYLQSNGVVGTLFRLTGGSVYTPAPPNVPLLPPMAFYRYYPRIYYVRDYAFDPGDGLPALCRIELQPETSPTDSTPRMAEECVAVGIENLQLTWGIDTDEDLTAERYLSAPSAAQLANALVVRIQLLVRSSEPDGSYVNRKTYTLGDRSISFTAADNDHFLRRIYTTTVKLRNRDY